MKTTYAYGRLTLPTPTIITNGAGNIQGGGNTYYFWIKAKNRVGLGNASSVKSLVIANNLQIQVDSSNFSTLSWEDWRVFYLSVSTTNDFSTSRIIYKQDIYDSDQVTPLTINDLDINNDFVLNGNVELTNAANFPTNVPNGFRVKLLTTNKHYEYLVDSNLVVDNITVFNATGGQWVLVKNNSLLETDTYSTKELYQVTQEELTFAPLENGSNSAVAIKYYIINDDGIGMGTGELDLNAYISDTTLKVSYDVEILGYLNLTNNTLDTSGIQYVNTVVSYPSTKIQLSKELPNNSALVLNITPKFESVGLVTKGTFVTIYPKLRDYTVVEEVKYYGDPVTDIAGIKALPDSLYRNNQVRLINSKGTFYYFDETSSLSDDGDSVLAPNTSPVTGRWLVLQSNIQPESITADKLAEDVIDLFTAQIKTTTIDITASTNYTINLDTAVYDYFIVKTPVDDGFTTTLDVSATLSNNETKSIIIELRQKTGVIDFAGSILFPGGTLPTYSGDSKTDLFVIVLTKDSSGTLKKRAYSVQQDIG